MIADHPERHRYELQEGGKLAAEIRYRLRGADTIELIHTEVPPEFEGRGFASKIAKFAFDDARRRGLKVMPTCEYLQAYVRKHPEYAELVPPRT